MDKQEKDEPWTCPYCGLGFPCPCAMDAEAMRLDAMAQDYFDEDTEMDLQMTDLNCDLPDPYEELDELYNLPKFQKIQKSQTPVSDGHNLQRVTENARNRQLKAARKLKEIVREGPTE
jgi:hypothetical protein